MYRGINTGIFVGWTMTYVTQVWLRGLVVGNRERGLYIVCIPSRRQRRNLYPQVRFQQ